MIDRKLLEEWVTLHAPNEETKLILLRGIETVFLENYNRSRLLEKFPNKGNSFSKEECEKILAMKYYLQDFSFNFERDRQIEVEFGRPMKSIKARLRYMLRR